MFGFKKKNVLTQLGQGLRRTRSYLTEGLGALFLGKKVIDDKLLEQIQERLLTADVGVEATEQIIASLTSSVTRKELTDSIALFAALKQGLLAILSPCQAQDFAIIKTPLVILVIGVNGAGKTTSIGKLARYFQKAQKTVLLAAGDTFRAAAIEQLQVWGERNAVDVIAQQTGSDSAAVIFDALQAAKARNKDVLIADTAGRLHSKENLMEELRKIKRILAKLDEHAPEVLLVIDATAGQNALLQARKFNAEMGVTGLIITKLDGTAKGGIIFAIAKELALPIRFIGIGEGIEDLKPFDPEEFVEALFEPASI
jgi:fused signal recognition particle receptor